MLTWTQDAALYTVNLACKLISATECGLKARCNLTLHHCNLFCKTSSVSLSRNWFTGRRQSGPRRDGATKSLVHLVVGGRERLLARPHPARWRKTCAVPVAAFAPYLACTITQQVSLPQQPLHYPGSSFMIELASLDFRPFILRKKQKEASLTLTKLQLPCSLGYLAAISGSLSLFFTKWVDTFLFRSWRGERMIIRWRRRMLMIWCL